MNKLLRKAMLCVCFAAISGSLAIAQTPPNANAPPRSHSGMRFEQHPFAKPTERIEARLAYIRTALKITDTQQSQWDAYANFARKNAQEMEQRFQSIQAGRPEHSMHQRPNAIESLERQQAFHTEVAARLAKILEAQKPLYSVLSPEQQKVADVVMNPRPRQMPGWGGFRRG